MPYVRSRHPTFHVPIIVSDTSGMRDHAACVGATATVPYPRESRGEHGLGDSRKDHCCRSTLEVSDRSVRPDSWRDADLRVVNFHFRSFLMKQRGGGRPKRNNTRAWGLGDRWSDRNVRPHPLALQATLSCRCGVRVGGYMGREIQRTFFHRESRSTDPKLNR